jgi:hypothetical protein
MSDTENTPPPAGDGQPGPVPYSRFAQVNAKVTELAAVAEAAKAEAAAAKAAAAEWEGKHNAAAADWGTERAIMQRGITDAEGLAVAKTLFGMVPPEARPAEGIAGWLGAMTPETAPVALRGYLAGKPAPATPPPPPANAGVTQRQTETTGVVSKAVYDAELAKAKAGGHAALLAFRDGPIFKAYTGAS